MRRSTRLQAPALVVLCLVFTTAVADAGCDAGGDEGCTTEGDLTYCVGHEGDCGEGTFYCGEEFTTDAVRHFTLGCCPGGRTCCFWSDGSAGGFRCCESVEACITGVDAGSCE
jgi:hypothetical protein